jgi:uncharacterized membrane protein YfcA
MIGALAGSGLAAPADPQRLNAAFTALIVIVAGYTLMQPSWPGVTRTCRIPHRV